MKKIKSYLKDPKIIFFGLGGHGYLNWIPDKLYLQIAYRLTLKKRLNLKNPTTFNEKTQWLKLYDRKPEYTRMVDKFEAKNFIAERIGTEYVISTLGVWDNFDQIDFDSLPDQFVLKCTHDSGGLVVCRDKAKLDIEKARQIIESSLKCNYYWSKREWPYKDVKPRILAETYLEDAEDDALTDYKYFCFNGEAKVMYICKDHGKEPRTDFFDMEFNHLPIEARDPNAAVMPEKPEQFEKMRELAETLSAGIPHLRVDFYLIKDKIYVGELTFFHMSGLTKIKPEEWNVKMGQWINKP